VTLWGTRGSQASPGPETVRYGGNTSCIEVRNRAGDLLVLDAGTGIRRLGDTEPPRSGRVDVLLSHLHMDHIQGLGFCGWLYQGDVEVHVWGPASTTMDLRTRLTRYLSAPLFPVHLRDLPSVSVHDVPFGRVPVPGFTVDAALVCHPGPTVGYRVESDGATLAYLSDHEPALCSGGFRAGPRWTSGFDVARGADLLVHVAQYTTDEYAQRIGWGHSALEHTIEFATATDAKRLMPFHYDPGHDDRTLDARFEEAARVVGDRFALVPALEGATVSVDGSGAGA
jgi:phosphoribosyl 1,2-cyclic phosphodiesterase